MNELVSVIVTIYNNEKTLRNCILSIIGQTYRNMEIILVDDGSMDGSSKICDELLISNSKMKVSHQLHSGIASARNAGLTLASGKYVTFVNGSDTLKKDMIEHLQSMMNDYMVEIAIAKTDIENIKNIDSKIKISNNPSNNMESIVKLNNLPNILTLSVEDTLRQLLIAKLISNTPCGKLFNRNLFNKVKFAEGESETLYKLVEESSKIAFLNYPLYNMSVKENFSFNSLVNKDLRLMKTYPELAIFCKCNIVRSIQNEFFDAYTNNRPVIDEEKIYDMFIKLVDNDGDEIASFFENIRKAHMYLLANSKSNYKILCPVLPDITEMDI